MLTLKENAGMDSRASIRSAWQCVAFVSSDLDLNTHTHTKNECEENIRSEKWCVLYSWSYGQQVMLALTGYRLAALCLWCGVRECCCHGNSSVVCGVHLHPRWWSGWARSGRCGSPSVPPLTRGWKSKPVAPAPWSGVKKTETDVLCLTRTLIEGTAGEGTVLRTLRNLGSRNPLNH